MHGSSDSSKRPLWTQQLHQRGLPAPCQDLPSLQLARDLPGQTWVQQHQVRHPIACAPHYATPLPATVGSLWPLVKAGCILQQQQWQAYRDSPQEAQQNQAADNTWVAQRPDLSLQLQQDTLAAIQQLATSQEQVVTSLGRLLAEQWTTNVLLWQLVFQPPVLKQVLARGPVAQGGLLSDSVASPGDGKHDSPYSCVL